MLGRAATRPLDLIIALRPRLETPRTDFAFLTRPRFKDVLVGRARLRFETFAARGMKAPPDAFFYTQIVDPPPNRVHSAADLPPPLLVNYPSRFAITVSAATFVINDAATNNPRPLLQIWDGTDLTAKAARFPERLWPRH